MICDANTWIGHWPFRALPKRSAADLLRQMDKSRIDKALVSSLHGLLYKDAHEANRELAREVGRRRDRLVPCALLNPTYTGWREDLRQCRVEFGMPVLRLTPDYHGYRLTDPCAEEIVTAAHELKMRVALYGRIVDPRGRHRLDPGREADRREVAALLNRFPKARFLMLNFSSVVEGINPGGPRLLYDIARIFGANGLRLGQAIVKHGARAFVFGTTMLMRPAAPPLIALEKLRLTKPRREAIRWKNLFGLLPEIA